MANIILDVLPETVEIDGAEYRINSDFRISILFELLMQDDEVGKRQKLIQGLKLYYPEIPQNMTEAVEKMIWFYRCGRETENDRSGSGGSGSKHLNMTMTISMRLSWSNTVLIYKMWRIFTGGSSGLYLRHWERTRSL